MTVTHAAPGLGIERGGVSDGLYVHYRESSRAFAGIGAWFDRELSITEADRAERISAALTTPSVFRALAVQPQLGRVFEDADAAGRFVLISHELWTRRYGADRSVIGRTIEINHLSWEIVGVLPPGFGFPRATTQLWMANAVEARSADLRTLRFSVVARLRDGITAEEAQTELSEVLATLGDRFADASPSALHEAQLAPRVVRLHDDVVADVRPTLMLVLGTALFVLLVALANVANLMMVRAERIRREIAVERALGAGAANVFARCVAEGTLLAIAGGVPGLLLAVLAVSTRFGFAAWQVPRLDDVAIGSRTLWLFACALAAAALLLSMATWAYAARADIGSAVRGGLSRVTGSRESQKLRQALATMQVALACALLIGSTVLVQSARRLQQVELGFEPEQLLTFEIELPYRPYPTYTSQAQFFDRLEAGIRALPGVTAVGAASLLPLTPVPVYLDVQLTTARDSESAVRRTATMDIATPAYFNTLGIPLLSGRIFEARDLTDAGAGVVLSESLAHALFGDDVVIGRRVYLADDPQAPPLTVIGVVGDVRGATLAGPVQPLLYLPALGAAQPGDGAVPLPLYPGAMTLAVRSALPADALLGGIRAVVGGLDPQVPVARVRSADMIVADASARVRLASLLVGVAAATALLLGFVGVYGVVAYAVSRRLPELALRTALGAEPARLAADVVRQSVGVAVLGIGIGVALALAMNRMLVSLLFDVSPREPGIFIGVTLVVLLTACAAAVLPARRAMHVQPAEALRRD